MELTARFVSSIFGKFSYIHVYNGFIQVVDATVHAVFAGVIIGHGCCIPFPQFSVHRFYYMRAIDSTFNDFAQLSIVYQLILANVYMHPAPHNTGAHATLTYTTAQWLNARYPCASAVRGL